MNQRAATPRPRAALGAFTLIELLVVISVVAVLIGLIFPALGGSRESARRVKCLSNLKSMGAGFSLYLNDYKGIFPNVKPLHTGNDPGEPPNANDPSLLDVISAYLDATLPRRGEDGYFIVGDPFRCPSDTGAAAKGPDYEPVWRTDGVSYEYYPGVFMLAAELLKLSSPGLIVTRAYENQRNWPILVDQDDWHNLRTSSIKRNAVFFPDFRADWMIEIKTSEVQQFFAEIMKYGGG